MGSRPVASSKRARVTALDAARVLATWGIVWVHTAEIQGQPAALNTLGRFGTSFYILAAVFFVARSHMRHPEARSRDILKRRAGRLLRPYLLWCAVYAAFYFTTMRPQGHPVSVIVRYWGPLFGTAPHLWFLPFAFFAGVIASLTVPRLSKLPGWLLVGGGLLVTAAAYLAVYATIYPALDKPWITQMRIHRLARWVEEAPLIVGACVGCAIYAKYLERISRWGRKKRMRVALFSLLGFLLTQFCYAWFLEELGQAFLNRARIMANLAGAFWLVTMVSARRGPWLNWLAPLGQATYFAYLSHQLILDASKGWLAHLPGHGTLIFAFASTNGIFALSVGFGWLVARSRRLRWLSP